MSIEVRPCATLDEFDECVRIQQIIWGHDLVVPTPIFVVAQDTGGQVLGAFHDELMVGFSLAVAGAHQQEIFLHSHMAAVLPKYQNQGVGRKLKLAQRHAATARGIDLIEWTFDPLELKNAHFNLVRLGAVARRYIPNCYGITASPLHAGLPTDRLVAEWRLNSERVHAIIEEKRFSFVAAQEEASVRISVPADIGTLKECDTISAEKWQREIRQQFQQCFEKGYIAVGVKSNKATVDYILAPESQVSSQLSPRQSVVEGRR